MQLIRQTRLSVEEASQDWEKLEATDTYQELKEAVQGTKDIKDIEQMAQDNLEYMPPTIEDDSIGKSELTRLKKLEITKTAEEIYYLGEVLTLAKQILLERFGIKGPNFPVERIIYLSASTFDNMYGWGGEDGDGGRYDRLNNISIIRYNNEAELPLRLHIAVHEYLHFVIFKSLQDQEQLKGVRKAIEEAVIEQTAIEISMQLLLSPDLTAKTVAWLADTKVGAPDTAQLVTHKFPSFQELIDDTGEVSNPNQIYLSVFGYHQQRLQLQVMLEKLKLPSKAPEIKRQSLDTDALGVLLRYLVLGESEILDPLLEAALNLNGKEFTQLQQLPYLTLNQLAECVYAPSKARELLNAPRY